MHRTLPGLRTLFFSMSVTSFYGSNHSRGGGTAPPEARKIHKNDIERWRPQLKNDSLPPLLVSYTMPAALLKLDHPYFFDFVDSSRVDDDFLLHSGFFCLFQSDGIFFGPCNDFFVCQTAGTHRNSKPGLESSADKCKTLHRTIDIGAEVITKQTCLRSCKQPEDGLDMNLSVGLPAVRGSSFSKARSCRFGLFLSALELNVKNME